MNNPFINSDSNLRYYSFSYYCKNEFKSKISKISLDAGFNCPNRDGQVAYGGCSFCSEFGSGDFIGARDQDLITQYDVNKEIMFKKWPKSKTIPYFQAYTNTYTSPDNLKRMIELFIYKEEVVAIDIATRPDCLSDEMLAMLVELNAIKPIWLELGLQTADNKIAQDFNRGYNTEVFIETMQRIKQTKLKVCVHLINGLVNETRSSMIDTAKLVSNCQVDAIKFHMLHVVDNSRLGYIFKQDPFDLLSKDEYVDIVVAQLQVINPNIIIERLTGDSDQSHLLAPVWTKNKIIVLNDIQKRLVELDSFQGQYYNK